MIERPGPPLSNSGPELGPRTPLERRHMTRVLPTINDLREFGVALRRENLDLAAFAHGMTPREYAEARRKAYVELAALATAANPASCRQRKPRIAPPGGLLTSAQAAAKLGCSIKTLNGHVAAGDLRYVIIGKGTKRPRKMFADSDLAEFIANQTRKDEPCPSTASRARRSSTSSSESTVIAFTAAPKPRPGVKPKR